MESLLVDPHLGLEPPAAWQVQLIQGPVRYYHYLCDGVNDAGWGCGYRTLQSLASWLNDYLSRKELSRVADVPSIQGIQQQLVAMGDKEHHFLGSRDWIGSVEVALVLDALYDTPCRILHLRSKEAVAEKIEDFLQHFKLHGSPIMMGGDRDASSKGVFGAARSETGECYLLIVDPHYCGTSPSRKQLQAHSWVQWLPVLKLDSESFYNVCLPLVNKYTN